MTAAVGPLTQIILFVQDMAEEVHFFRDVLGFAIRTPQALKDYSEEMWVEFETGACIVALHARAKEKPNNLHELIFTVEDIEQVRKAIIAAGIEMSAIRTLEDSAYITEGSSPSGHRFGIRSLKASV